MDGLSLGVVYGMKEVRSCGSFYSFDRPRISVSRQLRKAALTIEEAFTQALFEQIEEEYDRAIGEEAYQDYVKDGKKSLPISALWKEIGL